MPLPRLLSILCALFPLVTGFSHRRHILWWYAVASLISDLILTVGRRVLHEHFKPVGYVYLLLEFVMITTAYRNLVFRKSWMYWSTLIIATAIYVWRTRFFTAYDALIFGLFAVGFIIYSLLGFFRMLTRQESLHPEKSFFFWVNVGFLLYGSGACLLFLFTDYLKAHAPKFFESLWTYGFAPFNILNFTFLGIAFLQLRSNNQRLGHGLKLS